LLGLAALAGLLLVETAWLSAQAGEPATAGTPPASAEPAATSSPEKKQEGLPPRDFPALVLASMLNVGAILFGVFGFLYSVYALYSSLATPANPIRAPICNTVRNLCRMMSALFVVTGLVSLLALALMWPFGGWLNGILAAGLALPILAIMALSVWMAWWLME
jgi:hypothetical protein